MRWIRLFTAMFFARFRRSLQVTDISKRDFRVWITDIDVSMMNHAAMMTVMETGRIDFMVRTGFFRLATNNKWYVPSAAISVRFFRPLKMFQKATVKTRVFHIEGPWIYLEQVITRNDRDIAACIVKSTVKKGKQHIDASEVLEALNAPEIPSDGKDLVKVYEEEIRLMAERNGMWKARADKSDNNANEGGGQKKIKIGIADDHSLLRTGLSQLLSSHRNMEVIAEGNNGQELISNLDAGNLPDIVLLDTNMPVMDGIECANRLTALYPSIKLIGMLMGESDEFVKLMMKSGVQNFVNKDDDPSQLFYTIQSVYKGRNLPIIPPERFPLR